MSAVSIAIRSEDLVIGIVMVVYVVSRVIISGPVVLGIVVLVYVVSIFIMLEDVV